MTDKNTLNLAREWAEFVRETPSSYSEIAVAAADIISSLPDITVDGDKLREVIEKWKGREITSDAYLLYHRVEALLPAPLDAEHGEAPCLLDKDGDHWVKVDGQWHMVDPDFAYDELPELHGPYRPFSKSH